MMIKKGNGIFLLSVLLCILLLYTVPVGAARLAGDNEITPTAPQPASGIRRTPQGSPAAPNISNPASTPASDKNSANPQAQVDKKVNTREAGQEPRYVTIDFDNVDIALFIKFISELTGKNFVIDSNVRGKVTIISPTKISVDEAYQVFQSVLEVNGFTNRTGH